MRLSRLLKLAGDRRIKQTNVHGLAAIQDADLMWAAEDRIEVLHAERDEIKKILAKHGKHHRGDCKCLRCEIYTTMKAPDYV